LLALLGCLKADASHLPRPLAVILINLLASTAILNHECFAFFTLTAMAFLQRGHHPARDFIGILRSALPLLPSVACFILYLKFHGTTAVANAINDSWNAF
jgi:hypothetical protein